MKTPRFSVLIETPEVKDVRRFSTFAHARGFAECLEDVYADLPDLCIQLFDGNTNVMTYLKGRPS